MTDPVWQLLDLTNTPSRLDRAIGQVLQLSRQQVRRLLARGHVRVNGHELAQRDKGRMLTADDRVEVRPFAHPDEQHPIPNPALPLTILDQGPGYVVVDKPAGTPVHPLQPDETGTVLNGLIARYPQIKNVGEGALRAGVVHRLDVTTTGTLIFALDPPTWQRLRDALKTHRITKQYLALVQGILQGASHEQHRLIIAQHRPARVRVLPPSGPPQKGERLCTLAWQTQQTFADATLVSIILETGFLHQIRAIFSHLGHPLLGDTVYNADPTSVARAPRPMLHASRLALDDIDVTAPMPADMHEAIRRC